MNSERLEEARIMAEALLREHGLTDWTFRFNRSVRTLGLCYFDERRVELSRHFVLRNPLDDVREALRHEVAHALAGPEDGHGPIWRAWCARLGAEPKRTRKASMPDPRYWAKCECGKTYGLYRRPKINSHCCSECGTVVRFGKKESGDC